MRTVILIGLPIITGVTGQLLLKAGMQQIGSFPVMNAAVVFQLLKVLINPYVFMGFICYALGAAVWVVTLTRIPLSFAYPMLSINYIGILLGSKYLFGEDINLYRWVGVAIICFGVMLVGKS